MLAALGSLIVLIARVARLHGRRLARDFWAGRSSIVSLQLGGDGRPSTELRSGGSAGLNAVTVLETIRSSSSVEPKLQGCRTGAHRRRRVLVEKVSAIDLNCRRKSPAESVTTRARAR